MSRREANRFRPGVEPLEVRAVPSVTAYDRDFEPNTSATLAPGVTATWSNTTKPTSPSGETFLGAFGNQAVTLTLNNLPSHNHLTVEFDLYLLRSWDGNDPTWGGPDGDRWSFQADGATLLDTTFRNPRALGPNDYGQDFGGQGVTSPGPFASGTGASAVNTLGYTYTGSNGLQPMDSTYHFSFPVDHVGQSITLTFTGSGLQGLPDESWGLDNVKVVSDTLPVVTVEAVNDATEGGPSGTFRFTRTGDLSQTLTANYIVDGSATSGTDYAALSGSVIFTAGAATVDATVAVIDDSDPEYAESVEAIIVSDGADYWVGDAGAADLLIVDNEAPQVSTKQLYDALEGGWKGALGFLRTGNTSGSLTVNYSVGGTATSGADYTPLSGSATFQPGEIFTLVEVEALTDATSDPGETVLVTLQGGTGYTIDSAAGSAGLTIIEDPPVVWIDSSPATVPEGQSDVIVLKRSGGDLSKELTVAVYIGGESSTAPRWIYDYSVSGQLSNSSGWSQVTFAANEDTATLTIQAREDDEDEGDEDFVVQLGTGDGTTYLLGASSSVSITIPNVIPSGTVPVLADNDTPLGAGQVNQLRIYLELLGKGKTLTGPQQAEMEQWLTRLKKYGLEAEGEQRLQQLQSLIGGLGEVVKRPAVVGKALDLYSQFTDTALGLVKVGKENEYMVFKQQMGGLIGNKAKEKFNELEPGLRPDWAQSYWIRYQAEILKEKLNSMKKP